MTRNERTKLSAKYLSEGLPFAVTKNGVICFDPQYIDDYEFKLEEILWVLSRKRRYNDHCDWTVLRHSILCHELTKAYKLEALAHDFQEAYVGDILCMLRSYASGFRDLETQVLNSILRQICPMIEGWQSSTACSSHVHRADEKAAQLEMSYFFKWDWKKYDLTDQDYEAFHTVKKMHKDDCIRMAYDILD